MSGSTTAADRAAGRIRAIPLHAEGPDWHPDMRVARKAIEIAEAMRTECLRILAEEVARDAE